MFPKSTSSAIFGMTIGGQGITSANRQYGTTAEHDSIMQDEAILASNQEDMMMAIPREGNAETLNKSTKLTLSSKK